MEYFVGIGLPPDEERLFGAIKRELHPHKRLSSPPHITLAPPFYRDNEKELLNGLARWAQNTAGFEINLTRTGIFRQAKYGTIFLESEDSENINQLQASLVKTITNGQKKGRFRAHLTLAQRVPFEDLAGLTKQVRLWNLRLDLKIDRVRLYKREPGKSWMTFKDFVFGLKQKTAGK